jgi:hypothetical protein
MISRIAGNERLILLGKYLCMQSLDIQNSNLSKKEYKFPGCDAEYSGKSSPKFRKNIYASIFRVEHIHTARCLLLAYFFLNVSSNLKMEVIIPPKGQ